MHCVMECQVFWWRCADKVLKSGPAQGRGVIEEKVSFDFLCVLCSKKRLHRRGRKEIRKVRKVPPLYSVSFRLALL